MLLTGLRELSNRVDERVPARPALRRWRRTRPFWGGAALLLGGTVITALPLAPLPVMIHVGMAAVSGVAIGAILVLAGLFLWFAPAQRAFVSVVAAICALVSVVTTNLGGGGLGALLALLGAAMGFGWRPGPRPAGEEPSPPRRDAVTPAGPERNRPGRPDGSHRAPAQGRWTNLMVTLPVVVAASLVATVAAHRPAAAARAAAPEVSCVPVPGATRPWWIPERLWLACPNPSTSPSQPTPTSTPPQPSPSGSTSKSPSGSVSPSASASASVTAAPAMANPGELLEIRYGRNVPEVAADTLTATGFTFRGTVDLPTTGDGTVKALVFHADNLKAGNYRIRTTDPGARLELGIDLDIDDVDIYATHLGGLITVPYLNVPLLPVEITADLIPTWLPLNIWLPAFSGNDVKAGQVFIRAGTVRGSDLSAEVRSGGSATRPD